MAFHPSKVAFSHKELLELSNALHFQTSPNNESFYGLNVNQQNAAKPYRDFQLHWNRTPKLSIKCSLSARLSAPIHLTENRLITILNLSVVTESSYLSSPGQTTCQLLANQHLFPLRIAGGMPELQHTTSALCDNSLSCFHFSFLTTVNAGDTLVIHLRESD